PQTSAGDIPLVSAQTISKFAIYEDEGNAAVLSGTIRPSMIGTALDDNVASFHQRFSGVHNQRNFALKNDSVIHGLSAMHKRVTGCATSMPRCLRSTDLGEVLTRLFRADLLHIFGLRGKVKNADPRAPWWRSQGQLALRRLTRASVDA